MAYSADSFTALEVPTLAKMNKLWANDAAFNDGTGLATGSVATAKLANNAVGIQRLSAIESTDLFNGTATAQNTWIDFKGNQNFTVDSTTSLILISISGRAHHGSTTAAAVTASRLIIDSGGTPITRYWGGMTASAANSFANPFSGGSTVVLTGLAAGTHTVKTQILSTIANSIVYCRIATVPLEEHFRTEVWEIKK